MIYRVALVGLLAVGVAAEPRERRRRPCPPEKQAEIGAALRHFGLVPEHPAAG